MNVEDNTHNKALDLIKDQRVNGKSWEQIKRLDVFGTGENPFDLAFKMFKTVFVLENDYNVQEWELLVDHIKDKESERGKSIIWSIYKTIY